MLVCAPQNHPAASAQKQQLVKTRVLKNRSGLYRIRHLQENDLAAVAQLQVRDRLFVGGHVRAVVRVTTPNRLAGRNSSVVSVRASLPPCLNTLLLLLLFASSALPGCLVPRGPPPQAPGRPGLHHVQGRGAERRAEEDACAGR